LLNFHNLLAGLAYFINDVKNKRNEICTDNIVSKNLLGTPWLEPLFFGL